MKNLMTAPGALLALLALWPAVSHAQEPRDLYRENEELRSRIDRLESVLDQLQSDDDSLPRIDGVDSIPSFEPVTVNSPIEQTSFSNWNQAGAVPVASPVFPTVKVTGFFQADAGLVSQNNANQAAVGNIQNGADFRRARLAATGNVAENVGYMLEMDFAFPGRPSFMDVWGEIRNLDGIQNLRFGQYRNPFGMDGLTSVKELTFLERGLPFAFLPFRQIGMMAHGASEAQDATWAVSGFRFPTDTFGGNVGDSGGFGMATRLTTLIADDGENVVHLGGAYSIIDPANNMVQYRNQPEFFVSETGGSVTPIGVPTTVPLFVDTGAISTRLVNMFSGEFAATSGPYHAQAEFIYVRVDQKTGGTVNFSGASAQAGWILTGEHRPYDRKGAVLGRITPHCNFGKDGGCGAWEVAARWSYLDLNSGNIAGGQLNDVTAGLNWYLNRNARFQFNYIHAFLKSAGIGDSDADILATRAQIDF